MTKQRGSDPIVIWGAGAVGGTIGAYLARAGHDVLFVDVVAEHVARIREGQLSIEGPVDSFTTGGPALTPDQVTGQFSRVLLAVKSQHTVAAVEAIRPHLRDDGYIVSCQNGLNAPVIADLAGESQTIAATVAFAPDWIAPGRIMFGNRGPFAIGELDGRVSQRTLNLQAILRDFEPETQVSHQIYSLIWSKAALGVLLKASALTNDTIANYLERGDLFAANAALVGEVVTVAHAIGLELHAFQDFDPEAFGRADRDAQRQVFQAHARVRRASAKQHSGVWRDIAVRKRQTEVREQLSPIRALASRNGVPTPMLDLLASLFERIEAGKHAPGDGLERELRAAAARLPTHSHHEEIYDENKSPGRL